MQAASFPHIEQMVEGIILTSPALRVKPAHPVVGVSFYMNTLESLGRAGAVIYDFLRYCAKSPR